jgi:hypothetical protein
VEGRAFWYPARSAVLGIGEGESPSYLVLYREMYMFQPIDIWRNKSSHLRNIEITIKVLEGKPLKQIASVFNISMGRISKISNEAISYFCERCEYSDEVVEVFKKYRDEYRVWLME